MSNPAQVPAELSVRNRGILAAVLGRPIAHSKSPVLHRAAFAALGIAESSDYGRFELGPEELESFLAEHPEHIGFSVTMPLKERLVELARKYGWRLDDTAALTGAGNTLVHAESVEVLNTDVQGIVAAIENARLGASEDLAATSGLAPRTAVILGAGATARSAIVACHRLGVDQISLLVRNPERARTARDLCDRLGITVTVGPLDSIDPADIVISTLPAEAALTLRFSTQIVRGVALDVAYATSSSFLAEAEARGMILVEGTAMLVEQAVAQFLRFHAAADRPRSEVGTAGAGAAEIEGLVRDAMYAALESERRAAAG